MASAKSHRKSTGAIVVNTNVRCLRVYPTGQTSRDIKDLKTVGIKLSSDQAIYLARVLLVAAQEF